MRTQVAIVGAGPAGLILAHLLRASGIETVVIERQTRAYVEGRVRAGVLEQGTVDCLSRLGLDRRLRKEGLRHSGTHLSADGDDFRIDLEQASGGACVMVYGQQEVTRDLFEAAEARGLTILFEASDVSLHDIETEKPFVTFRTPSGRSGSTAISWSVATGSMASAARRSPAMFCASSSVSIRSAGSAFSPSVRLSARNSSMPVTSAASRLPRCVP